MPAYFYPVTTPVPGGTRVQFDSDTNGTPAIVYPLGSTSPIPNSRVRADASGRVPTVSGDAPTVYLRFVDYRDSEYGAAIQTVTGQPINSDGGAAVLKAAYASVPVGLRPRRLQGKRISRMVTTFAAGHGWTGAGGTWNLNDTSDAALGSQCISVVTTGGGNIGGQRSDLTSPDLTATPIDLTQYDLMVWYKIPVGAPLTALVALALNDTVNGYAYSLWQQTAAGAAAAADPYLNGQNVVTSAEAASGWQTALFDFSTGFTQGTPTGKTGITRITLRAYDYGGGTKATVKWGGVALVPKAAAYPNGVITIGLDDGYASQWSAAKPALDKYGFQAVAYVIQDLVPSVYAGGQYLGLDQLHQLEDVSGWEVAAHSLTSADHNQVNAFGALSESALRTNLEAHKQWLLSEGFRGADHFAYPQGKYTPATARIVRDYFTTARTVQFGNYENSNGPADPLRMRCYPVDASYSLATLQSRVDQINAGRMWGQFYLHQIVTGATGTSTTPTIFSGLIDYIAAQGVAVRTVSDVLAGR